MRTTLDLDEEILRAVKDLARQQDVAIGKVVSNLVRQALTGTPGGTDVPTSVAGFRPFAANGRVVSNSLVDDLRDSEGV